MIEYFSKSYIDIACNTPYGKETKATTVVDRSAIVITR